MSTVEARNWLQTGIAAVKAGERKKARALLMKVLEADERNEQAWLWLSGAVAEDEERRICLENVLALNPSNKAAQKGLAKLGPGTEFDAETAVTGEEMTPSVSETKQPETEPAAAEEIVVRREYAPVSPAAAILYPERQAKEWVWRDDTPLTRRGMETGYKATSSYNDVWARNVDICAYCAQEIEYDQNRCPKCKRNLTAKHYRYPDASSNLHILWIIMVGLGQLFIGQVVYYVAVEHNVIGAIAFTIWAIFSFVLAVGIFLRQFWAYITAVFLLSAFLVVTVTSFLAPINLAGLNTETVDPAIAGVTGTALTWVGGLLKLLLVVLTLFGLIYSIFKAGADFERVQTRLVATVTKGLSFAGDYHMAARKLSQKGMWAAAVLHWQRAAAKEPTQIIYQRHLGQAYARLGFYERSLDVLQSAHNLSTHPAMRAELKRLIQLAEQGVAKQEGNAES